jgi:hypothetical protein
VLHRVIFCKLAEGLHTIHEDAGINIYDEEQKGFVQRMGGCA